MTTNERILRITDITEEEQYWLFVDRGIDYLDHYFPGSLDRAEKMKRTKAFWTWWGEIWRMLDQRLIDQWQHYYHVLLRQGYVTGDGLITYDLYERWHMPNVCWYPNSAIHEMIKEEVES